MEAIRAIGDRAGFVGEYAFVRSTVSRSPGPRARRRTPPRPFNHPMSAGKAGGARAKPARGKSMLWREGITRTVRMTGRAPVKPARRPSDAHARQINALARRVRDGAGSSVPADGVPGGPGDCARRRAAACDPKGTRMAAASGSCLRCDTFRTSPLASVPYQGRLLADFFALISQPFTAAMRHRPVDAGCADRAIVPDARAGGTGA